MFRRKAAASPPSPTESEPPSPPPPSEVSSPPETPSPPPPEVPSPPEVAAPTAPVTKKTVMKKPKKKQAGEARERAAAREALLSMDVGTPKPATVNEKTDEPTRKDDPEPPIEETESPSMEVDPPAPPANHSPASPQSPSFSSSAIQTIFAPFQIITRIAEKAVDVAVGNTKEDILKRKVQMSLEHVANNPILDGVIGNLMRLLKVGVDLMDQFECNYFAAKVFKQRLSKAIVCLAYPRRSIFAQKMDYDSARLESQEDYKKIIADLEITLSSSLRFFSRFTQPDHVLHSLVGKECKDQFSHLNEKLESSLKDLHQTLGCSHSSILLPAIDHYTVVCDLKVMVDEDARNRDAFITRIKEERKYNDDDITEFIEELEEVKKWVKETSSIAKALVGPWPGSHSCYGIRQRNLQRFWIESLGMHCISVTPTEFIDAARTYFEALYYNDDLNEGDDVIVASLLDEVLPKMLDMIPKDPAYPECMDFFSLAKHVRSLPLQGSAVSIFQKLAASIAEGGTCILPPPPASPLPSSQFVASSTPQTFWESDDEMLVFNELISSMTPAWAVISGPKYSGKTHRLLTACHLTRSSGEVVKDYVWIDLAGVSNDKEAISKIASQLCFRGICDMEQLSLCLFSYLKALRAGSVVVVDNVDTESPVLSPCLHSLLSTFHDASNATSTSSLRFILSCRVADSTLLEKITGPLNKNNVPLTQINVSPLSSAPAAHMASNLKAISFPLLPTDAQAIVTAGLSLPGLMSIIINQCTLSVIRKLANDISTAQTSSTPPPSVSSPDDEAIKSFYVEAAASVAKELGADERLCALCMSFLPRPSTPFSEPLAWALCRNAFNGDLIRWLVAFRGLVDCNWFVSTTDNHYIPSFLSSLCPPSALGLVDAKTMAEGGDGASSGNGDAAPEGELKPQADSSTSVASTPSSITEDGQRTLYLNYWVSFLISMSEMSVLSASALEQFNTHYMHISTVLGLFAEESSDPQTSKGVSSSDIAVRLAGFLSPILTQYYPQPVGLRIAVAVETALRDVGDASASLRAACDVGRQMRRGTPGKKAKAFHKEAIANLKGAINKVRD